MSCRKVSCSYSGFDSLLSTQGTLFNWNDDYKISGYPQAKVFSKFELKLVENREVAMLVTLLDTLNDLLSNPLDYEDFQLSDCRNMTTTKAQKGALL